MPRIHTLNPAAINRRGSVVVPTPPPSTADGRDAATATAAQAALDAAASATTATGSKSSVDNIPLFRYNGWWKVWWDGEYSLILTKAAFLHRDFLKAYTEEMPSKIR